MKKTILFTLIVVGLAELFFVRKSISQERIWPLRRRSVQKVLQKAQQQKRINENFGLIDDTQDVKKSQRLHNEYPQLFQQHPFFMNSKELTPRRTDLHKVLGEYKAKAKLQQAEKLLQEILKTYPQSRAAKQARRMLETEGDFGEEGGAEAEPGADVPDRVTPGDISKG